MARAYHQLPFGGRGLSDDEFFRQRIGYDSAHENPDYQAELEGIAANLESLFSEKPTFRTDSGRLRIEHPRSIGHWVVIHAADSFKSVREGQKQQIYKVSKSYMIYEGIVYERHFEITNNLNGQFNFREASVSAPYNDTSRQLANLVTFSSPKAPTNFDLHELQVAIISLETLKSSD